MVSKNTCREKLCIIESGELMPQSMITVSFVGKSFLVLKELYMKGM